jgi:hypothetical protein
MALDREAIYTALFSRLSGLAGFITTSRVWKHWDDVIPDEQPALFLSQGNEMLSQQLHGMPPVWKLQPMVYIYCRHDSDPATIPGSTLNVLIQAVEGALERTPTEATGPFGGPNEWSTTLGGLCSYVKIDGQIVTDEGLLGEQAVCVIPLEILTTS